MAPLSSFPVSLPFAPIPSSTDAEETSLAFLPKLALLTQSSFIQKAVWRDLYALTGTLRTFYSPSSICTAWEETSKNLLEPANFSLVPHSAQIFRAGPAAWVQATFSFEIAERRCQAIVALVRDDDGEWRIWLLRTVLVRLKGGGSADFLEVQDKRANAGDNMNSSHFDCVVVGAGLSGLSVAGRLEALGLSYVVLEKYPEVGDNWRMRYDSAKLHLPRETAHLPFERTFGPECPDYLPKNIIAQGYQTWVKKYNINVRTNTRLENGEWNPSTKEWTLKILQGIDSRQITCSHIVMAVGGGGQIPMMPEYLEREIFKGETIHSVDYRNSEAWKGKHGVVIGTANTAHDVAEDMLAAGLASVTMVQRSPTYVLPAEYIREVLSQSYNAQIPTSLSDQGFWSLPCAVIGQLQKAACGHRASMEPERFDALEKAGFKLERNGSIAEYILGRFGGHCVDVGSCAKITNGEIKVKSVSLPVRYLEDGLEFADGSQLKGDVILFATGFLLNMKTQVSSLFSPEIGERMGDYWGVDGEGEIKGAFRPCGQKGMWYVGGDQSQSRYFSRFVALSIEADVMGVPLSVYNKEI